MPLKTCIICPAKFYPAKKSQICCSLDCREIRKRQTTAKFMNDPANLELKRKWKREWSARNRDSRNKYARERARKRNEILAAVKELGLLGELECH